MADLFGLTKPSGRFGAPRGKKQPSVLISSYHDEKEAKYRQQTREKVKRWMLGGTLAAAFALFGLGGVGRSEQVTTFIKRLQPTPPPTPAPTRPPTPPPTSPPTRPLKVMTDAYKDVKIETGLTKSICLRKIGIDLQDHKSWTTPYTPSLSNPSNVAAGTSEVILIHGGSSFAGGGANLNEFFHAYDKAFEKKQNIYITKDNFILDYLSTLFISAKGDQKWATLQKVLNMKVSSASELTESGHTFEGFSGQGYFYYRLESTKPEDARNHRETIMRGLISYPSSNACKLIQKNFGDKASDAKYSVVHSTGSPNTWLGAINAGTNTDNTAANNIEPEYVKNILKKTGMMNETIIPIFTGKGLDKLMADPELKGQMAPYESDEAGNFYLGVLADVFIGDVVDHTCLWIARMRFALGLENTFVFTKKEGNDWVSVLSKDDYLLLYDAKKLGLWMG